jgi:hypothetical protein
MQSVALPNSALLTDAFSSLRCACGAAKRERSAALMFSKVQPALVAVLIGLQCAVGFAEETFKPFQLSFWVRHQPGHLPKPSPTLEVHFPADFEVVNFRTGNGGPFYGRRQEIDELQRAVDGKPKLLKGVFQVMDILRIEPGKAPPLFDRTTNRFLLETKLNETLFGLSFNIESMRRADTRSFPILLAKAKFGSASVYSSVLVLPDDAIVTITYWMPQPPTKANEEIWERFISSIREM